MTEILSALLSLCMGNMSVTGGIHSQKALNVELLWGFLFLA